MWGFLSSLELEWPVLSFISSVKKPSLGRNPKSALCIVLSRITSSISVHPRTDSASDEAAFPRTRRNVEVPASPQAIQSDSDEANVHTRMFTDSSRTAEEEREKRVATPCPTCLVAFFATMHACMHAEEASYRFLYPSFPSSLAFNIHYRWMYKMLLIAPPIESGHLR